MQEILIKAKNYFGTADVPYYGPTYILPDGSLLDLRGRGHHSSVEHFLIDNNLSDREYIKTGGSPTIEALGCIRCDNVKYYIGLSEEQPTREQYNSLLIWLDNHSRTTKLITVMSPGGKTSIDYRFTPDFISDDVVDRIRRYYVSGKLYEQLDKNVEFKRQYNFKYKRELLGESLKEAEDTSIKNNYTKYKVVKYGQWWYGILNTETNIILRVGPNPNYDGPLDDKENKLLLFKSKEKAQEYIDNNLSSIFYSLYLIDANKKLKEEATKILDRWYEKEKSHYNIKGEFLTFVKNTLHDKIMNCKILEDRNVIWQVIDENQINIKDELKENNLVHNLEDSEVDFDERWDKEFGQYMDGIQVMKADDAINLLKRMERFE